MMMKKLTSGIVLIGCMTGIFLCGCQGKTETISMISTAPSSEMSSEIVPTAPPTEISTETLVIDTTSTEMPTELPSVDIHKTNSKIKITLSSYTNSVSQGGEAFAEITASPSTEYLATVLDKNDNAVNVQNITSDENGNLVWQWNVATDFPTGDYTVNIQGDSKNSSFTISVVE